KVKAFQIGAADYITKPFYLEEVLVRVQMQLTIQSLQKELKIRNDQLKQILEEVGTTRVLKSTHDQFA
ncbi:MAG TPA: hybrid sensor histidine kinase/response regulator, partial [Allocoleopsis sp.]